MFVAGCGLWPVDQACGTGVGQSQGQAALADVRERVTTNVTELRVEKPRPVCSGHGIYSDDHRRAVGRTMIGRLRRDICLRLTHRRVG